MTSLLYAGDMIQDGSQVAIEYTLTLANGTTADTNVGQAPLVYQQGGQQILPALEQALVGLAVGDTKKITLAPEQGYGVRDPELLQDVDVQQIPEDARTVGTQLLSQGPQGERHVVRVHEIHDDRIVLDLNHPLAGETLHFAVKVIEIS